VDALAGLPTHGHFISSVVLAEGVLTIRLKPESPLEPDACAWVLSAHEPVSGESVLRALERLREAGEYVYVFAQEGSLMLSAENGEEVSVRAQGFGVERTELSATEFREALAFSAQLYQETHESYRKAERKVALLRELLHEQARRVALKAEGHEPTSSVGVLYSQHAQFIERLLRETEV
jgi:hypothetical protein